MASRLRISTATDRLPSFPAIALASSATFLCGFIVAVGDHDVCSAFRRQQRSFAADAAAAADDQHHLAAQFFLRRLTADLGFFQLPSIRCETLPTAAALHNLHAP